MFSSELPHRGDSYEYTQYTIFNIKKLKNITLNYPESEAMELFPRDSSMSLKQQGKQAISVRATEVLLHKG